MLQSTWNPGAATPHHSTFSGSRTPAAWEAQGRTPAHHGGYDAPTPGFSAATPGAEFGSHPTPRNSYASGVGGGYGGTYNTPAAATPGAFTADTPAAYGAAQTPGVGGDDDGYE